MDTVRPKSEEKEYFDSLEDLDKKVCQLAELITKSNHFIAFTGAGISTACGIADYRSGKDTVLNTGPGKWVKEDAEHKGIHIKKPKHNVNMMKAYPSITHFALKKLQQEGLLKFLISQNVDGLHRKTGIPQDKLCELHGNYNIEYCKKCATKYWRDYKTRSNKQHLTGRYCRICQYKQPLYDPVIDFGEDLDSLILSKALHHAKIADLCLVLGSSLTVFPAADLPKQVCNQNNDKENKGDLVIINLQKTRFDHMCSLRIFAKCEDVMELLIKKLKYKLPKKFVYDRYILAQVRFCNTLSVDVDDQKRGSNNNDNDDDDDDMRRVTFYCMDNNGTFASYLTKMTVNFNNEEPMIIGENMIDWDMFMFDVKYWDYMEDELNVTLSFINNYYEPDLKIPLHQYFQYGQEGFGMLKMSYNAYDQNWKLWSPKEVQDDIFCNKLLESMSSLKDNKST